MLGVSLANINVQLIPVYDKRYKRHHRRAHVPLERGFQECSGGGKQRLSKLGGSCALQLSVLFA